MKNTLIAALLAATPFAAMAATAQPVGHLDIYYTDSESEIGGADDDGSGFGARGSAKFADQAFVFGEYQTSNFDNMDSDLDQIRAGLGYVFSQDDSMKLYAKLGFANFQLDGGGFDESESGWTAHGGLAFMLTPAFKLFGELGYLDAGDFGDGLEYTVGVSYAFSTQFGVVANYRVSDLEDGDVFGGDDAEVSDLQFGVRFHF
jgi:opacity protein-like surface antigen